MAGCTQILLIIVKGNEQEIKAFKTWYEKKHPLLIRKYHPNSFTYNSEYAEVWFDNPNEFSFFIQRFWPTNTDSYYSINKTAKRFNKLKFYNTFHIHHESSSTYHLSTEGLEVFKKGKPAGFIQMAINAVNWNNLISDGIPETMYDSFLRMNYVLELLNKPGIPLFIETKLKCFTEIHETGIYKEPVFFFNELVSEVDFFSKHLEFYRPLILKQLQTNKITIPVSVKSDGNNPDDIIYFEESAETTILNYALKSYVQDKIPQVRIYLTELFKKIDAIAEDLLSGKMNKDVLGEYYLCQTKNIYDLFTICEGYEIEKYGKIYQIMKEVNDAGTYDDGLPF